MIIAQHHTALSRPWGQHHRPPQPIRAGPPVTRPASANQTPGGGAMSGLFWTMMKWRQVSTKPGSVTGIAQYPGGTNVRMMSNAAKMMNKHIPRIGRVIISRGDPQLEYIESPSLCKLSITAQARSVLFRKVISCRFGQSRSKNGLRPTSWVSSRCMLSTPTFKCASNSGKTVTFVHLILKSTGIEQRHPRGRPQGSNPVTTQVKASMSPTITTMSLV